MEGLILAWTGLLGACVGSFTNVVAWRLPRQESVVFPGSHCPKCGHAIRWHDNLPLLGWLLLRGRCRDCDAAISWRYPAVEALSAGLWISALLVWPGAGGGAAGSLAPLGWSPPDRAAVAAGVDRSGSPLAAGAPVPLGGWCWACSSARLLAFLFWPAI